MIKFILIGGYPFKAEDGGKAMCQEAVVGLTEPIKILLCVFARQKADWRQRFVYEATFFGNNLSGKKLDFKLADEDHFVEQIKAADVIYFSGGDTTELLNRVNKNPGWQEALKGKVVLGSSAGCDLLSKYNYDTEHFRCEEGFGLVPVKTFTHYESEDYTPPIGWESAHQELKDYKEDLPIWLLHEGEYKVYEQKH